MKVGTRLYSSFIGIALILVIVGVIGIVGINQIRGKVSSVVETAPLIDASMKMAIAATKDRLMIMELMTTTSNEELDTFWKEHIGIVNNFNAYGEAILNGKETEEGTIYATKNTALKKIVKNAKNYHDNEFQPRIDQIKELMMKKFVLKDKSIETIAELEAKFDELLIDLRNFEDGVKDQIKNKIELGTTADEILATENTWADMAMEMKTSLAMVLIYIEKYARITEKSSFDDIDKLFHAHIEELDEWIGALLNGAETVEGNIAPVNNRDLKNMTLAIEKKVNEIIKPVTLEVMGILKQIVDIETKLGVVDEEADENGEKLAAILKGIENGAKEEIGATQAGAQGITETSSFILIVVTSVGLAIAIALSFFITRAIARPLKQLSDTVIDVEHNGDFSKRINVKSNDEVGQTVFAFNCLMESLQSAISGITDTMRALSLGDFSKHIAIELKGDLDALKKAVNGSCTSVSSAMDCILATADQLKSADFAGFDKTDRVKLEGELQTINNNMNNAVQSISTVMKDINRVMKAVATGDLTQRVSVDAKGDINKLKDRINNSVDALSKTLANTMEKTHHVAVAAGQSSSAVGQISDGAQNQMHSINEIATAIKETNSATEEVCQNISKAGNNAQQITQSVNKCKLKIDNLVEVVKVIAQNSEEIGKITDVIETIANKTNMLSLNAAIEAAGAGEHGKGFAVVADEVRKLAEQSANSAQNIAELIEQAVSEAGRAVSSVTEVNSDMETITVEVDKSDKMLEQIAAITEEQSAAMQQVSANVSTLNQIGETNAAATEEITATVMDLSRLAKETKDEIEVFKLNGKLNS